LNSIIGTNGHVISFSYWLQANLDGSVQSTVARILSVPVEAECPRRSKWKWDRPPSLAGAVPATRLRPGACNFRSVSLISFWLDTWSL